MNGLLRSLSRRDASLAERLFKHFPGGAVLLDADYIVLDANPDFPRYAGHSLESLMGRRITTLDVDPLRGKMLRALNSCLATEQMWQGVLRCRRADGVETYQDVVIHPLTLGRGKGLGFLMTLYDVSHLYVPAQADRAQLTWLEGVMTEIPGVIFQLRQSPEGDLSFGYLSQGLITQCGMSPETVMADASQLLSRIHPEDMESLKLALAQSTLTLSDLAMAFRIDLSRGSCWMEAVASPRHTAEGVTLWEGWLQDVTRRKQEEERLQQLVSTDVLTGLLNRRAFFNSSEAVLAYAARRGSWLAVAVLDIDHFKVLNDTYGHAAGDVVLQRFARLCRSSLRPYDLVARIGGEEFVVMLVDSDPAGAWRVTERLRQAVEDNHLLLEGKTLQFTVSAGLAYLQPGGDLPDVLERADRLLYSAKQGGRNCIRSETAPKPGEMSDPGDTLGSREQLDEVFHLPVACPNCGCHRMRAPNSPSANSQVHCAACARHVCLYHEAEEIIDKGPSSASEQLVERAARRGI
jgi:diguanylate cyclase (GGDEF)-like protein/PAS domain S-box-containing protein